MLKQIRTFFGKVHGIHQDKKTVVQQGTAWVCTECHLVFLAKQEATKHSCEYRLEDSVVRIRKNAETKI